MKADSLHELLLTTIICTLPILGGPAFAEQAAGASASSPDNTRLSEVVVTAQRKAESLIAVAGSIEAHSAEQLKANGINNLADLQFATPGYTDAAGYGETEVYIRGVGNSVFVGADPSVATYVDDVPRVFGTFISAFTDVDRVEVLKGAQGGLYGRNATGGVINIISRQPSTSKYTADASVTYGSKDTLYIKGFVNIPLGDKMALSIAGERDTHGPYTRNIAVKDPYSAANFPSGDYLPTGPGGSYAYNTPAQTAAFFNSPTDPPPLNDLNLWTIDAKLLMKPTDNFKDTLAVDYTRKHDDQGLQEFNLTPAVGSGLLGAVLGAFGPFVPTPGLLRATDGPFTAAKDEPTLLDVKEWGISNTAVVSLDGVDVTAIAAYRKHKPDEVDDIGQLSVPIILTNPYRSAWSAYGELRAISTGSGPFHWLTGFTYLHEHYEENILTEIIPPLSGLGGPLISSIQDQDNYSVYAQFGYDITSKLTLTVSGRFIEEDNYVIFTSPPPSSSSDSVEQTFLPSADLSYKVPGGGNVYARFAEGFKGGGINPAVSPVEFAGHAGSTFGPEHVNTYEVGYRSTLFDHKVQVTGAAFYNDYKGLQVSDSGAPAYPAIIFAIVNAGSARTYGVEGSVTWKVAPPITVGVDAGYLNAKYKQFVVNDSILLPINLNGHQMIFAPSTQLSLTGALDQPVGDKFRIVGDVLASYTSRTLFQQGADLGGGVFLPNADQAPYWLVNLRLGVRTADDKYGIAVFVNNVFNQAYSTQGGSSASTGTADIWGDPRIVGVEVSAKF